MLKMGGKMLSSVVGREIKEVVFFIVEIFISHFIYKIDS